MATDKVKAREVVKRPEVQVELPLKKWDPMKVVIDTRERVPGHFTAGVRRRVSYSFVGCKKLTEDSHLEDCDIKVILKRQGIKSAANLNIQAAMLAWRTGDGRLPDFQTAQNIIASAHAMFDALPAKLRDHFQNDPSKFLAFSHNAENRDLMEKMGISTAHLPPLPKVDSDNSAKGGKSAPPTPTPAADKGAQAPA